MNSSTDDTTSRGTAMLLGLRNQTKKNHHWTPVSPINDTSMSTTAYPHCTSTCKMYLCPEHIILFSSLSPCPHILCSYRTWRPPYRSVPSITYNNKKQKKCSPFSMKDGICALGHTGATTYLRTITTGFGGGFPTVRWRQRQKSIIRSLELYIGRIRLAFPSVA